MRFHRHQAGRTSRWHSVRARHDDVWDWCAHHEEIERHLLGHGQAEDTPSASERFTLQAAH